MQTGDGAGAAAAPTFRIRAAPEQHKKNGIGRNESRTTASNSFLLVKSPNEKTACNHVRAKKKVVK